MIPSLVIVALLTARAWSSQDQYLAQYAPEVQARLNQLSEDLDLTISSENPPLQYIYIAGEPSCLLKKISCNTVHFGKFYEMLKAVNVTFSVRPHVDADISTPYGEADTPPVKITAVTSTAITDYTTSSWKISIKVASKVGIDMLPGEITGEYSQGNVEGTAQTTQRSVEALCPVGHRCTIQTLSYHATITGVCLVKPNIDCGGGEDACLGFRTTHSKGLCGLTSCPPRREVPEWTTYGCDQFRDFAEQYCRTGSYQQVPCEVYTPVLDESGKVMTSVIVTRDARQDQLHERQLSSTVESPPALPRVEFLVE